MKERRKYSGWIFPPLQSCTGLRAVWETSCGERRRRSSFPYEILKPFIWVYLWYQHRHKLISVGVAVCQLFGYPFTFDAEKCPWKMAMRASASMNHPHCRSQNSARQSDGEPHRNGTFHSTACSRKDCCTTIQNVLFVFISMQGCKVTVPCLIIQTPVDPLVINK